MKNLEGVVIKLDASKLSEVLRHKDTGIKSYLSEFIVPVSIKIEELDESYVFVYQYEDDMSEGREKYDLKSENISLDLIIHMGSETKRLYKISVLKNEFDLIKKNKYSMIGKILEEFRVKHPRWGALSAVANSFKAYKDIIDKQLVSKY